MPAARKRTTWGPPSHWAVRIRADIPPQTALRCATVSSLPICRQRVRLAALSLLLMLIGPGALWAQTFQFLPEVNAYSTIRRDIRFQFQAKETREAANPTQVEIGPSFDFFVKPLVKLERMATFDPDTSSSRLLQLSAGFRYVPSPDGPHVERMIVAATGRLPLPARFLLADRNRVDLNWSNGGFNWRYRNRLSVRRWFAVKSYRFAPYAGVELYYLSQYRKWTDTALTVGCDFPLGKHLDVEPYYEHQNITSSTPNQQYNQFGLVLNIR